MSAPATHNAPTEIGEWIDNQEWIGTAADTVADSVKDAYEAAGPAGKSIENALNGVWLGHPLHPVLVSVPLGAWTTAAVLDALDASGQTEMASGADAAVAIGLVGAAGAAITGLTQWYPVKEKTPRRNGFAHALLNTTATLLYAGSLAARKSGDREIGRALGWMGFSVSIAGAYIGGDLAYRDRMGVDHSPRKGLPNDFMPVLDAAALPENTPTKAVAGTVPLVLVKRGDKIHCLADSCSHFGGPLSEGKLEGDCITCPWHGSRFHLADGSVADGPATFAQPHLETRVRDGKIEVRAPGTA